ncbi:MAG: site-2 protease family protein, partial [Actinomycetota bacterium]
TGSLKWSAVAIVGLIALAVVAPSGLLLLGFLGLVITVHEAGHFVVARRTGMRPTEFFWGFGPVLLAVERNGCRYGLRLLFVGGYVKLHGMTPSADLPEGFEERDTFRAASPGARLATILAGPGVNLVLAGMAFGVAAALEGASAGSALSRSYGDLWFVVSGTVESLGLWAATIDDYVRSVFDPSASEAPVRFLSPVGQAEVSAVAVDGGIVSVLRWFGILSAAVGVVNMLPLPPLDGAHAVVAVVDGALRRLRPLRSASLDVSRAAPIAYVTIVVLVALSVSALVLDLRDLG